MILLVSGSIVSVGKLAQRWPNTLGQLITPSNRNSVASLVKTGLLWAADNGAFSGFDPVAFRRLLARVAGQPRCLFVVSPDVVADAVQTIDLYHQWRESIAAAGQRPAFVLQDGQEDEDVPPAPAYFVGGSTRWKLSSAAADLCQEAKRRGAWVHVGRVNSRRRMQSVMDMGADSIDGSSASRFGDKYIHKYCLWIAQLRRQPVMFA